jgi:succinate dehydrogenase / fumarate reductase cytochrome b subunit
MKNKKLPLSPHLQIYKWSAASIGSIMHRFTGIVLYALIVAISIMIIFYGNLTDIFALSYETANSHCKCGFFQVIKWLIYIMATGIVFSLYYHLLNGIRHLFWDVGVGFDKKIAKRNAIVIFTFALFASIFTVFLLSYFLSFFFKF